jgi:hypothetical protein
MNNLEALKFQYLTSADNLEKARNEYSSVKDEGIRKEYHRLKYMGVIILNVLCRDFYQLEANPTKNESMLSAIAPVLLNLFEAYLWYSKEGNPKLRSLARERRLMDVVNHQLKKLKDLDAYRIESYKPYRDKLAGHFDLNRIHLMQEFSNIGYAQFQQDAINVISYGKG